jgi:hypothetical protein
MTVRLQTTRSCPDQYHHHLNPSHYPWLWSPPILTSQQLLTHQSQYMFDFIHWWKPPSTTELGGPSQCSTNFPFPTCTSPDRCSQERPKEDLSDPTYIILSCNQFLCFQVHHAQVTYNSSPSSYPDPTWSPAVDSHKQIGEQRTCTSRSCPSHKAVFVSFPPKQELRHQN